jgi:hypothetical protein
MKEMPELKPSERTHSVIESYQLVKIAEIPVEKIEFRCGAISEKSESLHGAGLNRF